MIMGVLFKRKEIDLQVDVWHSREMLKKGIEILNTASEESNR